MSKNKYLFEAKALIFVEVPKDCAKCVRDSILNSVDTIKNYKLAKVDITKIEDEERKELIKKAMERKK
jgi:hypothetical protein